MDLIYYLIPATGFEDWTWYQVFGLLVLNDTIRNILMIGGLFYFFAKSKWAQDKRVYRMPYTKGQIASELKWAVPTILFDTLFFAVMIKSGFAIRDEANFWPTFVASFLWLEVWFYVSHRALHHPKLYFMHKQHHVAKVTSPLTSLSFSVAERAILLFGGFLPAIALSYFMPVSYFAIGSYLLVNTVLTLYIHMNVEMMPQWFHKIPVLNWINPVSHHALHHSRYRGHYGLYTPFLDRWFKTEFKDYEEVYKRAAEGNGLTSLGQKVEEPKNKAA